MAYLPPVIARLSAVTEDFDAKMDAAKAKIDSLNKSFSDTVKVKLDDALAQAKLDEMKIKLDEIHDKTVRVKVETDTSMLSKLTGLLNKFPSLGPLPGGIAGIGVIAAGLAVLLPEIVAVTNGLLTAGAGAAAFGALAYPAVKKVASAFSDLNSAQNALAKAKELFNIDPSKTNAAGLTKAADNLRLVQEQLDKLPASERGAVQGVQSLVSEFGKMARAFQPQVFKVFNDGLQVAGNLLRGLPALATPFATALDGLLRRLNSFTQSSGFGNWFRQFAALVGPATTAIGNGIANVANAFGKLMVSFSGKDVSHALNIAFGAIAGTITVIRVAIQGLKAAWDSLSQSPTLKRIVQDFKTAWDQISQIGKKKPDFSAISAAVKDAVNTAVSWLSSKMGPLVDGALKTASAWLSANASTILVPVGKAIMQGLIQGIESQFPALLGVLGKVAIFIAEHKGPIEYDRLLLVPHGQALMDGLMDGMNSRMGALKAQLAMITGTISGTPGRGWMAEPAFTLGNPGRMGTGSGNAGSAALAGAGGGDIHVHVTLDGREIASAVSQRAVQTQRRTGTNGYTKRTR